MKEKNDFIIEEDSERHRVQPHYHGVWGIIRQSVGIQCRVFEAN